MLIETIEQLNDKGIKYRKQAEELLIVLKERSLIEDFYAKDLERLSSKLPVTDFPEMTDYIKKLILHTASQASLFASSLSSDVIDSCKDLITSQAMHIKEPYLEGLKNEKRKLRLLKKVEDSKVKYWQCCEECEQVAVSLDSEPSNGKKEKLVQKLLLSKNNLDSFYKSYLEATDRYNKYKKTYTTKAKKVLHTYSHQEAQLLEAFTKIQKGLHGLESAYTAQVPPASLVPMLPVSADDSSKLLVYSELYFEPYEGSHPLFKNLGINSAPHLHASILEASGVSKGTQTAVEDMYRSEMGVIINKAWSSKDLTSQEYIHFNAMLKEELGRKAWTWCLNLKRTQGNFEATDKGFFLVGELMVATLNECERCEDVIVAKNCIILSQTFYKKNEQGKEYLQNFIMNHTLWGNTKFWEKLIINAITDELRNQGDFEIISEHLKSLVFCQLVSFGHIMNSFRISEEIIYGLVLQIGAMYSLGQEEAKEIMVMNI